MTVDLVELPKCKGIQNSRRRRSSKQTLHIVSTSDELGLQTNVIKMKWRSHCLIRRRLLPRSKRNYFDINLTQVSLEERKASSVPVFQVKAGRVWLATALNT
ncbi:hypothetical protein J6590_056652 [Homalodisca vitripennis]|nr:hypothetical protein J6590_056652 [Homalodisca vitripennis]